MLRFISLFFLVILCSVQNSFCDDKAFAIMKNHFNLKSAPCYTARISLMLIDGKGKKLSRSFNQQNIDRDSFEANYIEVTDPADIAGVRLLSVNKNNRDEQRLYLPALAKSRLISGSGNSGKEGRFLGSDINYYDLENKRLDDAVYSYVSEEIIAGTSCHIIDAAPKDKDCPYSKTRFWVDANSWLIHKIQAFDSKNNLIKEIQNRSYTTINDIHFVKEMVIRDIRRNHTTLYKLNTIDIKTRVSPSVFTVQYLER